MRRTDMTLPLTCFCLMSNNMDCKDHIGIILTFSTHDSHSAIHNLKFTEKERTCDLRTFHFDISMYVGSSPNIFRCSIFGQMTQEPPFPISTSWKRFGCKLKSHYWWWFHFFVTNWEMSSVGQVFLFGRSRLLYDQQISRFLSRSRFRCNRIDFRRRENLGAEIEFEDVAD